MKTNIKQNKKIMKNNKLWHHTKTWFSDWT